MAFSPGGLSKDILKKNYKLKKKGVFSLKDVSIQKQLKMCEEHLTCSFSVLTLSLSKFLSLVIFLHYYKVQWHFDIRHCIILLCSVSLWDGWINEWLLGRTGGMRQECVNYEWSFSRGLLESHWRNTVFVCMCALLSVCVCVCWHASMFNSLHSEQPCRKSVLVNTLLLSQNGNG